MPAPAPGPGTNNQIIDGGGVINTQTPTTTIEIPNLNSYNTYTDNPSRSQYVLLRDASGNLNWYQDLGVLGLNLVSGMPPPGFTTSVPVQYQTGTVTTGTTTTTQTPLTPQPIPFLSQIDQNVPFGTVVLAYNAQGVPKYWKSLGQLGWIVLEDPVPSGTPTIAVPAPTPTPPQQIPTFSQCGTFTVTSTGIPSGLVYGTQPGQYAASSGAWTVANYNQFGVIDSASYGNAPEDYVSITSVTPVNSYVNSSGITVCTYSLAYSRATRNPETPTGGGGGGGEIIPPPEALMGTITVAENSINNLVTFTGTGIFNMVDYVTVYVQGSTIQPAPGGTFMEYYYTPAPNYSGGDRIIFRLRSSHGTSNYGRIDVTVTPGTPILCANQFNFLDLGFQEPNTVLEGSSVTIGGGFPEEWNMALYADYVALEPGGIYGPRYYDSLYVVGIKRNRNGVITTHNITPPSSIGIPNSLRVGVLNGDIITPIIRTPLSHVDGVTVVTFRMRLEPPTTGCPVVEDTFTVRVNISDVNPDLFNFDDYLGLNPSASVMTNDINAVTVTGITAGAAIPIRLQLRSANAPYTYSPYGNLLIDSGAGYVNVGATSVVYSGYKVKISTIAPSLFSSIDTYRVTMGSNPYTVFDEFTVSTRAPNVTNPPWFNDATGLNPSQTLDTNAVIFNIEDPLGGVITVNNSATIVINGVDTGLGSTQIFGGQTISIRATSSASFSTTRTFTATLVVGVTTLTDYFDYVTRAINPNPTYSGDFVNRTGRELNEQVTSNTLTLSSFDGPQTMTLTNNNNDTSAVILKNSVDSGTSTSVSPGDTIAIQGRADNNDYYKTTTYTLTCGSTTKTWSITTKHNDHMILFDPY